MFPYFFRIVSDTYVIVFFFNTFLCKVYYVFFVHDFGSLFELHELGAFGYHLLLTLAECMLITE